MYGMDSMGMDMGGENTLILNANHPLVQYVQKHEDGENTSLICKQLYDLAMLAHKPLNPEEMTAFVQRSNDIMMLLTKQIQYWIHSDISIKEPASQFGGRFFYTVLF